MNHAWARGFWAEPNSAVPVLPKTLAGKPTLAAVPVVTTARIIGRSVLRTAGLSFCSWADCFGAGLTTSYGGRHGCLAERIDQVGSLAEGVGRQVDLCFRRGEPPERGGDAQVGPGVEAERSRRRRELGPVQPLCRERDEGGVARHGERGLQAGGAEMLVVEVMERPAPDVHLGRALHGAGRAEPGRGEGGGGDHL